jgi:predicted dehydrogenase
MTQTTGTRYSRRQAFKRAAALGGAATLPSLVRAAALGRGAAAPAGDRITLGFVGIGMMGQGHLRLSLSYPDTQVVAVCDVDSWRRENAKKTVESAYAAARDRSGYAGCAAYNDLRDLIARDDIDAVFVATGDRWHVPASILAAKAGKDIYCEKPMSLTIREARAMVEVARRYGCVFQTGLQQRATPEFQLASELVRNGRLGTVKIVYVCFPGTNEPVNLPPEPVPDGLDWDLWLGPAPWRPFNRRFHHYGRPQRVIPWHFCRDFGNGNLASNAVHAFDVVQWALGMDDSGPVEITPPETGKVPVLTYRYANGTLLQVDWKLDPKKLHVPPGWDVTTRIQNFGALYVGDRGWIHVGRAGYLQWYPEDLIDRRPPTPAITNPVARHHRNWLQCIRTRERPACDVEKGCRSTIVSHLGCIAHWTGRTLTWDPVREEFAGDEEANRLRSRAKRPPWRL